MFEYIGNYKFAFFAPGTHLEPSPEIIAKLVETYKDRKFFPTTLTEHLIGPTPQTRLQLQMISMQSEFNLAFEPNRVLFSRDNVPGIEMCTATDFVKETIEVFDLLLKIVPLKGTRLAYLTEGLLPSMSPDVLGNVNSRLLNLPRFYLEHPPFEWNTRNVARYEIILGDKVEITNVITSINRIQGLLQITPEPQPFDRIDIKFDINTHQNNKSQRFDSEDIHLFLDRAVTTIQKLLMEIEELLNV